MEKVEKIFLTNWKENQLVEKYWEIWRKKTTLQTIVSNENLKRKKLKFQKKKSQESCLSRQ